MEFRILGPVELWSNGRRHKLGSRKERAVLAVLLWELGRPVTAEAVVGKVWDGNLPSKPLDSLYTYVSRLRTTLEQVSDDSRDWVPGSGLYQLDVEPESVDLYQFRRLRDAARGYQAAGEEDRAFAALRTADQLWHGVPLANLDGVWAASVQVSLEEERYDTKIMRMESGLRLRRHASLVGELLELAAQHPLKEAPTRLLMQALYHSDRSADALEVFRRFRDSYIAELGIEPTAALHRLHERILKDDPGLALAAWSPPASLTTATSPTMPAPPVPVDNLPRDDPDFTGRTAEMSRLQKWMNAEQAQSTVPVIVISGMPRVGKTELAVHAARLFGEQGGERLFVELRSPDGNPVEPAAALGTLLRQLGVGERAMPASVEDRSALWRSRLSGRRALVLLDDAASSAQLRLLIPGAAGCQVLITTRRKTIELPGMRWIPLQPLPPSEAAELFRRTAGDDRRDDPASIATVLRLCEYLPQEIQFAARELHRHPSWSIEELATRLRESPAEDREVGVGIELTYRHLTAASQRLLRQLGLHPGPGFSLHAAAALTGDPALSKTQRALDVLLDYHLIEETGLDRYVFREMVWRYARRLASQRARTQDQGRVIDRLLDYYLHIADRADRWLHPFHRRIPIEVSNVPVNAPSLRSRDDCLEQMGTELPIMLSIARYAAAHGRHQRVGQLAHALARFLDVWGYWPEAVELHRLAVGSWRTIGHARGEAKALTELSLTLGRMGRHDEALQHASDALALARTAKDRAAEADTLDRMGSVLWLAARFQEAQPRFDEALVLWRTLKDEDGEADTLMHSGIVAWHLSAYPDAVQRLERALVLYRQLGDNTGEANALNNRGDLQLHAGDHDQALNSYQRALSMFRQLGDRQGEAIAVNNIGDVYRRTERMEDALACYRTALDIYRDLGDLRCEADTLNNLGAAYLQRHQHKDALDHHHYALVLAHQLGERYQQARSFNGTGRVHLTTRNHASASSDYRTALELSREIGDRRQEAQALTGLGDALLHVEGADSAATYWHSAISIYEDIGQPAAADAVRTRLESPAT